MWYVFNFLFLILTHSVYHNGHVYIYLSLSVAEMFDYSTTEGVFYGKS